MRARLHLIAPLLSAAALACGGDRGTGPDEAARVALELERAGAELGLADPTAALAYQSAATALRGGARPSQVDITVAGATERWHAFAQELHIQLPAGFVLGGFEPPPPRRVMVAWRPGASGMRVVHLVTSENDGPIGGPEADVRGIVFWSPSFLMYGEGRGSVWVAVRGHQTSSVSPTATPCPARPRPAGAPAGPTCVQASFTFGFSGVDAEPFVPPFRLAPGAQPATGARTLSMSPQPVEGTHVKVALGILGPPPLTGHGLP